MDVGSVQPQNGMFVMDGQSYDLGTLMLVINEKRTSLIDQQIADRMSAMQDRNKKIKALNELLATFRSYKAEGRDDQKVNAPKIPFISSSYFEEYAAKKSGTPFKISGMGDVARTPAQWMDHFGLKRTDVKHGSKAAERDAQWDANITAIQTAIDGLNSDSQLEMTQLQSLMNKRNTASDMTTNIIANDKKSKDTIVGNLR